MTWALDHIGDIMSRAGQHAWLEEGIVGLMTDDAPMPSGSKGSRATQELRRAEGAGVG